MPSQRTTAHAILLTLSAVLLALAGCASRPTHVPSPYHQITVPAERPGLATGWGESRVSWVEPAVFARAHASHYHAKGLLYYNDREGIDAMLDYLGGEPRKVTGLLPVGDVSFGLRGGDGSWLESWELKGKRFTIGERGGRYEIVVKNDSAKPVEVLVSVDGLDTLDGERPSPEKRGFVLDPNEEMAVDGLRTSDGEVRAFRFTGVAESYGQRRHANTDNCGVVGVAVFREGHAQPPSKEPPLRQGKAGGIPSSRNYAKPPSA